MRNESGQSLVLALIIIGIFMLIVPTVYLYAGTDLQSSQKQIRQTNAYYIAEAGLQRAIQDANVSLANNQTPAATYADNNFSGGTYQVTLTPKTDNNGQNVGYTLLSVGTFKNETKKISTWVKQPEGTTTGNITDALNYVLYANHTLSIRTMPFLGIHKITVDGNVHGNDTVTLTHNGGKPDPQIQGKASSTALGNIQVQGLKSSQKVVHTSIPMPIFDFDKAKEQAKSKGMYVPHDVAVLSILGISPSDKIIYIDGDLTLTGLDLLGLSLENRTLVVNGTVTGSLELGGLSLVKTKLNIIAKEDINFLGAITGLQVNGILFAQGNDAATNQPNPNKGKITTAGHCEVNGFVGARTIDMGSGILSGLLGLITGNMNFTYDDEVFKKIPSGVRFKDTTASNLVIVEQKEVH